MLKRILFGGAAIRDVWANVGLLVLRAPIGLMLAFGHGMGKLPAEGRAKMEGFLTSLNIPAPGVAAFMAMFAEFFGGLLLALGLMTRFAAFLISFTMLVAIATAHRADPLFMQGGGGGSKEPALLYMLPALLFLFTGSGRYGVDALLRGRDELPLSGGFPLDRSESTAR
jgi:putative oxidoreductase